MKHAIPLKRRKRMASIWLCFTAVMFALFVTVLYLALIDPAQDDDRLEIVTERLIVPEVTPVPEPPVPWVRYDVPLDDELQRYIEELCREKEVPAAVVMAIIEIESGCDPECIGDGGRSYGLMQIYASQHTARCARLGAVNLLEPKANVRVGIDFIAELLGAGHGIEWALSWYNGWGGEPCEYAYRVMIEAERLLESAMFMEG